MKRLKVLHIISSFSIEGPVGGVARHVIGLGRAFDPAQIELTIAGLWDYQTGYEKAHCARLHDDRIAALIAADWDEREPYQSCLRAMAGLRRANWGAFDIIHSHGEFSDLAAILLARRQRAKATVRTVHNEFEWSKRPLYGQIFPNLAYPFTFTRDLAISRQVAENLNRRPLARLWGQKAQVVYNGIDFDRFQPTRENSSLRQELGIPLNAPLIGTIGRMTRQKGYDIFLDALPGLLQQQPNAAVVLIGDGPLRTELEEQANRLGIRQAIHFTGPRKDIEQILPSLDLFVSSSRWEGLPTVLLESVAARVPVVATAVSGSVELVQHGVNGLLVPAENADTLRGAIQQVLDDLPSFRAGTEAVRQDTEAKFSLTAIAGQIQQIYRTIVRE